MTINPVFEAVHTEADGPENLQEHRALNMKKKNPSRGLLKRNKEFVSNGLL